MEETIEKPTTKVKNTLEEKIYKPILAVARQRPLLAGDIVLEGSLQRKSRQEIFCKTWANRQEYTLDYIFPSNTTQSEIFESLINPLVTHTLRGFTGLAVLYGQTGSGKSYTLFGKDPADVKNYRDSNIGQLPRALLSIFDHLTANNLQYDVSVSFFEVYNDTPRDLLARADPWGDDEDKKELKYFEDITEAAVANYEHFKKMLALAQKDQECANVARVWSEVSTVYIIHITKVLDGSDPIEEIGKLVFVELAGGENFGPFAEMERCDRQLVGTRRTFYALNKVIQALNAKEQTVPYMESKLTRILKRVLNPNCQIAIIATITPCAKALQETANTLDYAERLRFVIRTKDLQLSEPAAPQRPTLPEPGFELGILVLKTEQMRQVVNKVFEAEFDNFHPEECIINNVDDLYDAIQMMEIECLDLHCNYDFTAENISAALHRPNETGDCEVTAVEIREMQRYIESILDPLSKWKNRINFLMTNYEVTAGVRDFRLRFQVEKISYPTVLFHPFYTPRLTEETKVSAKTSESPRAELASKAMKTRKSKRRIRKTKRLFVKKQAEIIEVVEEPLIEEQEEEEVAPAETTLDVKPSEPKAKEKSSVPAEIKASAAGSTVSLEGVEKYVQDIIIILEEVRDELETLRLE